MPFFGPSLAGRSNSTTGTLTLTRWAAICAPITPAPSTATLRTLNRFMLAPLAPAMLIRRGSRSACGRAAACRCSRAPRACLPPSISFSLRLVDLAVVRVEDVAAVEDVLVVGALLHVAHDRHAEHRLVLALVGALVADRVLRRVGVDDLLDLAAVARRRSRRCAPATSPSWSSSSIVFHRPDRRVACAERRRTRRSASRQRERRVSSCRVSEWFDGAAVPIRTAPRPSPSSAPAPARALRISAGRLGQQLGEVEARGRQLGGVERVARRPASRARPWPCAPRSRRRPGGRTTRR